MSKLEKIYDNSPIVIQNLMVSIAGIKNKNSRYGQTYYTHLDFLKKFDELSLEEKQIQQLAYLKNFLLYVKDNSRYYRELYKDVDLFKVNSIEDLSILPIVDKEMLRTNIEEVITIDKQNSVEGHTGGTTGKSLVVHYTKDDMMKRMAMLDHFKARVGFEHKKMKRATFNGKHIVPPKQTKKVFWRYNSDCKQMIYSSFHLTEDNMKYYVESLNKFKPDSLDGFFMSMCDVASYIERHNIRLLFTPKAIFPTSETLTDAGRELLERVFKCKVYDQYASSEGAPFITECKHQNLHIEMSSGVFEVMEDGEILVTSFTTHGTPLIRYRIGDSIELSDDNACECGNESLMVKKIEGRKLDYLLRSDGAKVTAVNIANGFKNIPNAIIQAQVVQNRIGEILIKLIIDNNYYKRDYDLVIINEFRKKFGEGTKVVIQHVDFIPREKSGKFKIVVNNIG